VIDAVNTSSRPNYRLRENVKMATQRTFLKEYIKAIRDGRMFGQNTGRGCLLC
jgi:hypothetical protein